MINIYLLAIAVFGWALLVFFDEAMSLVRKIVRVEDWDETLLEMLKELLQHGAFYGSAVSGWMGFAHDNSFYKVVAVVWFIVSLVFAFMIAKTLRKKEEHEQKAHHSKVLGGIRSVVRSEISRANKDKRG